VIQHHQDNVKDELYGVSGIRKSRHRPKTGCLNINKPAHNLKQNAGERDLLQEQQYIHTTRDVHNFVSLILWNGTELDGTEWNGIMG